MSTRKDRLSALFTWRSALAEADEVSSTEDHVALRLSTFMSERGDSAFPGISRLARESKLAESTVREALKSLEAKGWLFVRRSVGGKGRTNHYEARIPWLETHREPEGMGAAEALVEQAHDGAQSPSLTIDSDLSTRGPADGQTHREPEGMAAEETHRLTGGTHRLTAPNPPGAGGDFFRTSSEDVSKGLIDPAAVDLSRSLTRLHVAPAIRQRALDDVERATAWLDVARTKATDNVAGFFVVGFLTGDWPSGRGRAASRATSKFLSATASVRNMMGDGVDPANARYFVDVEWDWLTTVERSELHELVDELASERLPAAEPESVRGAA